MRTKTLYPLALVVLTLSGAGPAPAELSLRNDAVVFPDGSVQTTAAASTPAGQPVQARVPALISDLQTCTSWTTLFSVPAATELHIDWMSVEIRVYDTLVIDVDLRTHGASGSVEHYLTRLSDAIVMALAPFASARWSSAVALSSVAEQAVEYRACRNGETGDSVVLVSFSGRLFDVAP